MKARCEIKTYEGNIEQSIYTSSLARWGLEFDLPFLHQLSNLNQGILYSVTSICKISLLHLFLYPSYEFRRDCDREFSFWHFNHISILIVSSFRVLSKVIWHHASLARIVRDNKQMLYTLCGAKF